MVNRINAARYIVLMPKKNIRILRITNRKPGLTCTLCGDCITRCKENSLKYNFLGMNSEIARYFFLVLAISLHAVFLGVARL